MQLIFLVRNIVPNFNITGGKELAQLLQQLPTKLEKNIMRGALRAGAQVIAKEAKLNVPVQDGDLKATVRVSTNAKRGRVEAKAKAGGKKAWYAAIVEFGATPHIINAKNGKMLKFKAKDGRNIKIAQVFHTGFIAKPYLRPALDSKAGESIVATGNYIRQRLNEQGINGVPTLGVSDE
jgi:HK97 gp10 family phage protein